MNKKIPLITFFVFVISTLCAQGSFELFKQHTEGIINFISTDQDRKTERGINYHVPDKKVRQGKRITKRDKIVPFMSQKYDFSTKTAYGKFEVLVITTSANSFNISFNSQYPIQQYQLKDTVTKNTSKEESLNDKLTYTISVAKPFEPKYVLILSMLKDEFLSPNIVALYKKESIKYK